MLMLRPLSVLRQRSRPSVLTTSFRLNLRTGQGRGWGKGELGRLTGRDDLSISWNLEGVRRRSTVEHEVRDLSGWIGASALLEWRRSRGDEAGDSEERGEFELHFD